MQCIIIKERSKTRTKILNFGRANISSLHMEFASIYIGLLLYIRTLEEKSLSPYQTENNTLLCVIQLL